MPMTSGLSVMRTKFGANVETRVGADRVLVPVFLSASVVKVSNSGQSFRKKKDEGKSLNLNPKLGTYRINPNTTLSTPQYQGIFDSLSKTQNHALYNKLLQDDSVKVVIGHGPAGVGKTLLPSTHAINKLIYGDIGKIVITRPHVPMGDDLGYLPGSKADKMLPWLVPIYDVFKEYITTNQLQQYVLNEEIEVCPVAYMRGRTFHNCWIIADEVQNTSTTQMKALLTRIGQNSKMCLTGDLNQCDLRGENGFSEFIKKYHHFREQNVIVPSIGEVEFSEADVMRSEVVRDILSIYSS